MRQVSEPLQNCTDHPKGFPYPFERRKREFEWPTQLPCEVFNNFQILFFYMVGVEKKNEIVFLRLQKKPVQVRA